MFAIQNCSWMYSAPPIAIRAGLVLDYQSDVTCIIGIVEIDSDGTTGTSPEAMSLHPNQFTTRTRLNGYGIKFAAVPIIGLSAVSEDFRVVAPIVARQTNTFSLGNNTTAASFVDANSDGRRMVYLSDLSVGEEIVLPTITDNP